LPRMRKRSEPSMEPVVPSSARKKAICERRGEKGWSAAAGKKGVGWRQKGRSPRVAAAAPESHHVLLRAFHHCAAVAEVDPRRARRAHAHDFRRLELLALRKGEESWGLDVKGAARDVPLSKQARAARAARSRASGRAAHLAVGELGVVLLQQRVHLAQHFVVVEGGVAQRHLGAHSRRTRARVGARAAAKGGWRGAAVGERGGTG